MSPSRAGHCSFPATSRATSPETRKKAEAIRMKAKALLSSWVGAAGASVVAATLLISGYLLSECWVTFVATWAGTGLVSRGWLRLSM